MSRKATVRRKATDCVFSYYFGSNRANNTDHRVAFCVRDGLMWAQILRTKLSQILTIQEVADSAVSAIVVPINTKKRLAIDLRGQFDCQRIIIFVGGQPLIKCEL